jgi:alcohol dehydrogenase class IV
MNALDPQSLSADWSYPTRVRFGPGRISELPEACRALGISRPLLVTDPALARHAIGQRALEIGRAAGLAVDVFAHVRPNPTGANVESGVEAFRAGGHDGVVALGGGSGLDAGKAIAFMAGQTRPIWEFEDRGDNWRRADTAGIAPVVAIPTTAGTGSEVGRAAVITNEDTRAKCIVFHPGMLPGQVIADPELTLDLPVELTAWTGLDALSHSLEALCAPGSIQWPTASRSRRSGSFTERSGRPWPRATISPPGRTCWRPRAWAPWRSKKGSARCTRSLTRSAGCSTAITGSRSRS